MTDATRTSGAPTRGIFITGTDTGVGKTVFTAALAARLRPEGRDVVALKPFASGAVTIDGRRVSADTLFIEEAAHSGEPPDELTPELFDAPLAPSVAARLEGRRVDVGRVVEHCRRVAGRHEVALVEGVGGLLAPLSEDAVVADFAAALDLPLVVVARPGLGTLNHTALTVECARAHGLRMVGIVLSGYPGSPGLAERTNPVELERLTGLEVLAHLPIVDGLDVESMQRGDWGAVVAAIMPNKFTAHHGACR